MELKMLGDEIYGRYLGGQSDDLETMIAEVAKQEELNPNQIARVCQHVNTKVFLKMFKTESDKTFEFKVADPSSVCEKVIEKPETKAVDISDSLFTLDGLEDEVEFPETIDYREVEALERLLQNKLDDITVSLMEDRPILVKRLASRIHELGPEKVVAAVRLIGGPEELLAEACKRAGVNLDDVATTEENIIVNDGDELLQNIAAYGKMLTEGKGHEADLEKVANVKMILSGVKKVPRLAFAYDKVKEVGIKTRNAKEQILSDIPVQSGFTVKNLPRRMPLM